MRFRFSRRAEADLKMIASYIGRNNPSRALSYVREMRDHCRRLTAFPRAHRLRPELGEGVRMSVFGNYVILYVVHPKLMENSPRAARCA
jgi:toxin ParE1/3/4